ncbi:hypothetical protein D3C73_1039300 [compost metagenome]
MLTALARNGRYFVTAVVQYRDGVTSNAAGRARDQHRAMLWAQPVLFEALQRLRRCEPGGA